MTRHLLVKFAAAVFALVSVSALAGTPEDAARKFCEAMKKDGFMGMFAEYHPDEIAKIDDMILAIFSDTDDAEFKRVLGAGETLDSLKKLPRGAVAKRFAGVLGEMTPQLTEATRTLESAILGHVMDGDIAYVVMKLKVKVEGVDIEMVDVAPFRRDGENWKAGVKMEVLAGWQAAFKAKKKRSEKTENNNR
jgi:hypothetical protein